MIAGRYLHASIKDLGVTTTSYLLPVDGNIEDLLDQSPQSSFSFKVQLNLPRIEYYRMLLVIHGCIPKVPRKLKKRILAKSAKSKVFQQELVLW